MIIKKSLNKLKIFSIAFILAFSFQLYLPQAGPPLIMAEAFSCFAQEKKTEEPLIVNGDKVEYSMDGKEFTASGNAQVNYKGTKLTCERLTVNTETKDAKAIGNARLEEDRGVIEGQSIAYNFNTKKGIILDAGFRANPYFGTARKLDKISEEEFIAMRSYLTTCSYNRPHYRIKSGKIDFFYGDKVRLKDNIFYAGRIPLAYLPQYNHSLRDPLMHVQLMPGNSKDWGMFLLSAWRYNLTNNINGRIYLDYREKLGIAEGFGANYNTQQFGKGDFKYYYTQERDKSKDLSQEDVTIPKEFQRYFIRLRHKWDIDLGTNLTAEYFKIVDSKRVIHGSQYNILKDYFPKEYYNDAQPLSYILGHKMLGYGTLDVLMQKRVNRWYSQEEKLPEIKYLLPNMKIGDTPFYFQNNSSYVNFNYKYAVPSPSSEDIAYNKYDTNNTLSLPTRIAFINLTPFVSNQETLQDKNTAYGSTLNVNFSAGSDLSTKFYRLFNAKTNFLGLDINGLRHIITPTAGYSYTKASTMPAGKARFGGGTSIGSSGVSLGLTNKLQTKRTGQETVDLATLVVTSSYTIKPKTGEKRGSSLSDFLFDLDLLPYSWLRVNADAIYKHTDKYSENYRHFSNINYDINFDLGNERYFGLGQRYQRKGGNEITQSLNWRLNPKWRFALYQRRTMGHGPGTGLREQEYTLSRDLHCWVVDFTYNVKRSEGESVWLVFRLKAFPELEFEFNQSYHAPKPGSQSN